MNNSSLFSVENKQEKFRQHLFCIFLYSNAIVSLIATFHPNFFTFIISCIAQFTHESELCNWTLISNGNLRGTHSSSFRSVNSLQSLFRETSSFMLDLGRPKYRSRRLSGDLGVEKVRTKLSHRVFLWLRKQRTKRICWYCVLTISSKTSRFSSTCENKVSETFSVQFTAQVKVFNWYQELEPYNDKCD